MRISDWSSDVCSSDLDYDLLRRDAVHHRLDELYRPAPDRRARRQLSLPQQFQFLDDDRGRGADDDLAVYRRICTDRLARLSAFVGHRLQPQCRRRLLYLGPTDSRSEEHTSELQSLMRISYAVFCLKKKKQY